MDSNPNVRAKNQMIEQIMNHRDIYKSATFRGAVTRRNDIAEVKDKWLLCFGVIWLAETRPPVLPFKQFISRDNFLLFETSMNITALTKSLEQLCLENIFHLEKVPIHFTQEPSMSYDGFYDSERSKKDFNIDWATDAWQIAARQSWGAPNLRELELENEEMPFENWTMR